MLSAGRADAIMACVIVIDSSTDASDSSGPYTSTNCDSLKNNAVSRRILL